MGESKSGTLNLFKQGVSKQTLEHPLMTFLNFSTGMSGTQTSGWDKWNGVLMNAQLYGLPFHIPFGYQIRLNSNSAIFLRQFSSVSYIDEMFSLPVFQKSWS
ncbi:hypothetical protein AVEN_135063-1 [Araneus ventricosus]|uniref:Uncharacterized protein n=1 Tax=Araneus ventricosus TaxID=182803 RepID=A0A4Y2CZM9_ARAVE|nr:hypothetical protein AVEN_135063-1 [Araneus ventricosus]